MTFNIVTKLLEENMTIRGNGKGTLGSALCPGVPRTEETDRWEVDLRKFCYLVSQHKCYQCPRYPSSLYFFPVRTAFKKKISQWIPGSLYISEKWWWVKGTCFKWIETHLFGNENSLSFFNTCSLLSTFTAFNLFHCQHYDNQCVMLWFIIQFQRLNLHKCIERFDACLPIW